MGPQAELIPQLHIGAELHEPLCPRPRLHSGPPKTSPLVHKVEAGGVGGRRTLCRDTFSQRGGRRVPLDDVRVDRADRGVAPPVVRKIAPGFLTSRGAREERRVPGADLAGHVATRSHNAMGLRPRRVAQRATPDHGTGLRATPIPPEAPAASREGQAPATSHPPCRQGWAAHVIPVSSLPGAGAPYGR